MNRGAAIAFELLERKDSETAKRAATFYPILIPCYDRPEYLARVLSALQRVEGIDETLVVASVDGSNEEVIQLLKVKML